jgi:hypothetical protein
MLKAGVAQPFTSPDIFRSNRNGRIKDEQPSAIAEWARYAQNMNVVAEITTDVDYDTLWAMDGNGVVRGKAPIIKMGGRNISFITLFADSGNEDLRLYFSNAEMTVATTAHVTFSPDATLGTLRNPYAIGLAENGIAVYPNTFTTALTVEFNALYEQRATVLLTDMVGNEMYRQSFDVAKGVNRHRIEPNAPEGMYVLSIWLDGNRRTWKVIRN